MDKEISEIDIPADLNGAVVNTVKHASAEEVEAAAAAEKERKQDYYVDPLEQEAIMEKRRQELQEIKNRTGGNNPDEEEKKDETPEIDTTIRPDMNINGFFSAGQTAKKPGFMDRSASKTVLTICMLLSVINAVYSAFYLILLISASFDLNWFMSWIYAVVFIATIAIVLNCVRSINAQNASIKQKALIGIVASAIAAVPILAWLVHWLTTTIG